MSCDAVSSDLVSFQLGRRVARRVNYNSDTEILTVKAIPVEVHDAVVDWVMGMYTDMVAEGWLTTEETKLLKPHATEKKTVALGSLAGPVTVEQQMEPLLVAAFMSGVTQFLEKVMAKKITEQEMLETMAEQSEEDSIMYT